MNSVFLDTNIILDFLDSQRVKHHLAKELIKILTINSYRVFISEDMITTIYYIAKDKQKVLDFFKVVISKWQVVKFGSDTILDAINMCKITPKTDLEDTLQCLCAKKNSCNYLITSDKSFTKCGIEILDYKKALETL